MQKQLRRFLSFKWVLYGEEDCKNYPLSAYRPCVFTYAAALERWEIIIKSLCTPYGFLNRKTIDIENNIDISLSEI